MIRGKRFHYDLDFGGCFSKLFKVPILILYVIPCQQNGEHAF